MSKEVSNEKIDLNSLTKKLCVEDLAPFESYLKDVWVDLYSRVNKNKNDPKEKAVKLKGLSKIIFNSILCQESLEKGYLMYLIQIHLDLLN